MATFLLHLCPRPSIHKKIVCSWCYSVSWTVNLIIAPLIDYEELTTETLVSWRWTGLTGIICSIWWDRVWLPNRSYQSIQSTHTLSLNLNKLIKFNVEFFASSSEVDIIDIEWIYNIECHVFQYCWCNVFNIFLSIMTTYTMRTLLTA